MKACYMCKRDIAVNASTCPHCGAPDMPQEVLKLIGSILGLGCALAVVFYWLV